MRKPKTKISDDDPFMLAAVKDAEQGVRLGHGGPFGACIVKQGEIVAVTHNTVLKDRDATCHAEMNAIRKACKRLGTWNLTGCEIFSTTEPCPMCFAAIHWARIGRAYFGATLEDSVKAGFNELKISDKTLVRLGGARVRLVSGVLKDRCRQLFGLWRSSGKKAY